LPAQITWVYLLWYKRIFEQAHQTEKTHFASLAIKNKTPLRGALFLASCGDRKDHEYFLAVARKFLDPASRSHKLARHCSGLQFRTKNAKAFFSQQQKNRHTGGYSVAGTGIAPATSRLCMPLRLSPPL
jgi:hypothetical protein